MKLIIEMTGEKKIRKFLALQILGILNAIEGNVISYDTAMEVLFHPSAIFGFRQEFPDIASLIGRGSELEDVSELIPEHVPEMMAEMKAQCNNILQESTPREERHETRFSFLHNE